MAHYENSMVRSHSKKQEPLFITVLLGISHESRILIVKNVLRFFKEYSVFSAIRLRFLRIPLKA